MNKKRLLAVEPGYRDSEEAWAIVLRDLPLQYWRSKSQIEVDFVIGDNIAIEVKTSHKFSERDHKGLKALKEEYENWKHLLVISQDTQRQKLATGIEHIYWEEFFDLLWKGETIR